MSRKGAPSWLSRIPGEVYTLHFWPPFGVPGVQQSKHYTGWTRPGRVNATAYNHYGLLRSIEDLFALEHLGYAAHAGVHSFGADVLDAG